jgi:DNA mismatch endonuclease (patch repair protein)
MCSNVKLPAHTEAPSALRSWTMSRVGSKHTRPELAVRQTAHALGLRYRLHRSDLPGTPDLVFPGRAIALFVNGCFWHRHNCTRATMPASNVDYWRAKFERNVLRDKRNYRDLKRMGWQCVQVWECETTNQKKLESILRRKILARNPATKI